VNDTAPTTAEPYPHLSEWRQFGILMRAHRRMLVTRIRGAVKRSRLMSATLLCFLVGYSIAAYGLFHQGLGYVGKLPGAGHLLTNRVLFLIFFCFFLMLTFSAAVTTYVGLFRSRETAWQLTLPVTHRVVFLWKTLESASRRWLCLLSEDLRCHCSVSDDHRRHRCAVAARVGEMGRASAIDRRSPHSWSRHEHAGLADLPG
jgi:hypothetical protein